MKLSVVLATYNEEVNLAKCLSSVTPIASEIIVVDGGSTDKTVEVAKSFGAKVIETSNPPIFHINKQKALDASTGDWILQLDADEIVSPKLAREIEEVIKMDDRQLEEYQEKLLSKKGLFLEHQRLVEARDGQIGDSGLFVAFFVPRLNYFLGRYLKWGGVYPDGVIRLVKNGKAHFPCLSVHEQIKVNGRVGWMGADLIHMADPTFSRYLKRNSHYIDLIVSELKAKRVGKNLFNGIKFFLIKPLSWFLLTYFRHKGFLDGFPGLIFSLFSALRFPRAFFRYLTR